MLDHRTRSNVAVHFLPTHSNADETVLNIFRSNIPRVDRKYSYFWKHSEVYATDGSNVAHVNTTTSSSSVAPDKEAWTRHIQFNNVIVRQTFVRCRYILCIPLASLKYTETLSETFGESKFTLSCSAMVCNYRHSQQASTDIYDIHNVGMTCWRYIEPDQPSSIRSDHWSRSAVGGPQRVTRAPTTKYRIFELTQITFFLN